MAALLMVAYFGPILAVTQSVVPPDMRAFLVPRRDYAIDDTWYAVGLCATGSKDLVVNGAIVPVDGGMIRALP